METTTFNSMTELLKKTANRHAYVELSNGYYIGVTKRNLKITGNAILKRDKKLTGTIKYWPDNNVQVTFL